MPIAAGITYKTIKKNTKSSKKINSTSLQW